MVVDAAKPGTQTAASARLHIITGSVTSTDGTNIGYYQLGRGPGMVILHGMMESALSHLELAEALADQFTVYLPDRRGRGLSGAYGQNYSLQKAVEDVDALLTRTGAHAIFGISAGAVIGLQAALTLPPVHKVAVFDPPLIVNGSLPTAFMQRYDREIAEGDVPAALVTAMKGAQMGPAFLNWMPRWLLKRMTQSMLASQERKAAPGDMTMRMLAPTIHHDVQPSIELEGQLDTFRALSTQVLLLGGSKSPAYMRLALATLEKILPNAERIEFAGLGHGAAGNKDQWGKPEIVAQALRRFFA